jgi:hypothetical protein
MKGSSPGSFHIFYLLVKEKIMKKDKFDEKMKKLEKDVEKLSLQGLKILETGVSIASDFLATVDKELKKKNKK